MTLVRSRLSVETKKKETQSPTLVKIDLLKLITKDEDHAFKGNNICNSFIVIT